MSNKITISTEVGLQLEPALLELLEKNKVTQTKEDLKIDKKG